MVEVLLEADMYLISGKSILSRDELQIFHNLVPSKIWSLSVSQTNQRNK